MENCPVPSDVRPEDVAGNIRMALRVHPLIRGAVTMFSAYGDFNSFPRRLREGCQRTGVKLVDVPNGRKDAADKAILIDMFLFALDNPPPSSILLISGDVDFAPALHILGQRGYTVILVIPANVGVAAALSNAGRFVWDWPTVARGDGVVPPRTQLLDPPESQNEEEPRFFGFSSCSFVGYGGGGATGSCAPAIDEGGDSPEETTLWVQPGDLQGLKRQVARLLELAGGSLPLVRLPPEYARLYGRPLYVAEYGAFKLVHLLSRMADVVAVAGTGHRKVVVLRSSAAAAARQKQGKKVAATALAETVDDCVCPAMGSSSDDFSDDDEYLRLESFRQEVQELLVCYSCRIPSGNFEGLYQQRYKKKLDYRSLGAEGLEDLVAKVNDVVVLQEEPGTRRKFLVSSSVTG
ncbi:unnamed protein product [Spirodela intermedia]|nr:unnamed protein product [Spirodela intermedia]CAA6653532.1 unnamed protein product [Spirodela intermedia]